VGCRAGVLQGSGPWLDVWRPLCGKVAFAREMLGALYLRTTTSGARLNFSAKPRLGLVWQGSDVPSFVVGPAARGGTETFVESSLLKPPGFFFPTGSGSFGAPVHFNEY
jgi:hypothetical protein